MRTFITSHHLWRWFGILLVAIFLILAILPHLGRRVPPPTLASITAEEQLWITHRPAAYQYRLQLTTFGPPFDRTITVLENQAIGMTCHAPCGSDTYAPTIDELFEQVREWGAKSDDIRRADPERAPLTISFDRTFHYPSYVQTGIGEYTTWSISEFRALPANAP